MSLKGCSVSSGPSTAGAWLVQRRACFSFQSVYCWYVPCVCKGFRPWSCGHVPCSAVLSGRASCRAQQSVVLCLMRKCWRCSFQLLLQLWMRPHVGMYKVPPWSLVNRIMA
jgi:hypothetical protein